MANVRPVGWRLKPSEFTLKKCHIIIVKRGAIFKEFHYLHKTIVSFILMLRAEQTPISECNQSVQTNDVKSEKYLKSKHS